MMYINVSDNGNDNSSPSRERPSKVDNACGYGLSVNPAHIRSYKYFQSLYATPKIDWVEQDIKNEEADRRKDDFDKLADEMEKLLNEADDLVEAMTGERILD